MGKAKGVLAVCQLRTNGKTEMQSGMIEAWLKLGKFVLVMFRGQAEMLVGRKDCQKCRSIRPALEQAAGRPWDHVVWMVPRKCLGCKDLADVRGQVRDGG